jgi:uncharacterized protein with PIN domain
MLGPQKYYDYMHHCPHCLKDLSKFTKSELGGAFQKKCPSCGKRIYWGRSGWHNGSDRRIMFAIALVSALLWGYTKLT